MKAAHFDFEEGQFDSESSSSIEKCQNVLRSVQFGSKMVHKMKRVDL